MFWFPSRGREGAGRGLRLGKEGRGHKGSGRGGSERGTPTPSQHLPGRGEPPFPFIFPPSFLKRERRRGGRQAAVEVSPPSPAAEEIRREANNVIHCWGARPLGLFIFRTLAAVIFDLPTSSAEFLLEAGDVLGGEELGIFLCSQRATVWCLFTPEFH